MTAICVTCGKEYLTSHTYIKRGVKNCSRSCSAIWRIGRKQGLQHRINSSIAKIGHNNPNYKNGRPKCTQCNKELFNYKAKLCWHCLIETKALRRLVPQGESHYRYNPDAMQNKVERSSSAYKRFRRLVLERDKVCQFCGSDKSLEVDHIKPFATHIELRLNPSNARVLCKDCHRKTPTYGGKLVCSTKR